jgi:hypothetical protein
MEHPFINKSDLKDKTLEELQDTISGLMTKLTFAYRTSNGPLIHQLHMALETYRNQQSKKMDEIFEKQKLSKTINIQSDS